MMTLKDWQEKVDDWISDHGVRYFNEMTNLAILMEEVGELSRLFAREFGEQSYKEKPDTGIIKTKMADEIGDILFVLTCLANQLDLDLEEVTVQNILKKTSRDAQRHKDNEKLKN